jgi:prevent-host-death family protein
MQQFSGLDLQRRTALVQEAALKEPVAITHHGRRRLVLVDIAEFERLKRRDKQVVDMMELPEEFLSALATPHRNAEQDALDHLMD